MANEVANVVVSVHGGVIKPDSSDHQGRGGWNAAGVGSLDSGNAPFCAATARSRRNVTTSSRNRDMHRVEP